MEEGGEEFGFKNQALIWDTFKGDKTDGSFSF